MGSIVSSVAQPVPGGSTGSGEGLFGRLIQQVINSGLISPVNEQSTQPSGITSIPVTNQNPTINMTGGRFNPVRDPKLNRVASRPMFRTSRYDSQISDLLSRLIPQTENKANGGRIGYADGSPATGLAIKLNRPVQSGDPLGSYYDDGKGPLTPGFLNDSYGPVNSLTGLRSIAIDRTQPVERKMGLFAYPDENMTNVVQALPRPGQYSTQIQSPSQTQLIKEAIMSLPQTRSNPQMNAMRKYSQVRDPRMMRLMQMLKRQPVAMGGIMNLKMGGMPVEMDLRAKGGFVPIGKKERADDVPARLSKNEFVFTANAVRNAGGGDIREGAKRMYNLMHKLEAKR